MELKMEKVAMFALFIIFGWWVIALLLAIFAIRPAQASSDLSPQQAMLLYTVAGGELGIGWPDKPPEIRPGMTQARLTALVCPKTGNCRPRAVFMSGVVYLRNDMDFSQPYDASVVAHEMVHYFQWWKRGGPAYGCQEWQDREAQAYAVQARIMEKAGHDSAPVRVSMSYSACQ